MKSRAHCGSYCKNNGKKDQVAKQLPKTPSAFQALNLYTWTLCGNIHDVSKRLFKSIVIDYAHQANKRLCSNFCQMVCVAIRHDFV